MCHARRGRRLCSDENSAAPNFVSYLFFINFVINDIVLRTSVGSWGK